MASKSKINTWSYHAGQKGKNRVRVYEEFKGGPLYLEWFEAVFDNRGPVIDPKTGRQRKRRTRLCLSAEGITTRSEAMKKAEQVAERFGEMGPGEATPKINGPLTLGKLLKLYLREVVPTKKPGTQRSNRIDARMFLAFFGADAVVERIGANGRPQTGIGRVRYNAFLKARAEGTIPGFPYKARKQTICNDVRFLRAVFRWAKLERDDGTVLLLRNPWEGFPTPVEDKPLRQEMTQELHDRLVAGAPNWRMAVVMELCRQTRRRMNSVRQLALEDINLTTGTVRWNGEFDKVGKTRVTPLTGRAIETIRLALVKRREEGLGESPWLLPAPSDPAQPVSRQRLHNWMKAARNKLGINLPRLGYHGEKRAGIRDPRFRNLAPAIQEELAGTTWGTMRRIYDYVDLPTLQEAVALLEAEPASQPGPREPETGLPRAA